MRDPVSPSRRYIGRCNLACDLAKLIDQLSANLHVYSGVVRNIFETCSRTLSVTLSLSLSLLSYTRARQRDTRRIISRRHDRENCLMKNAQTASQSRIIKWNIKEKNRRDPPRSPRTRNAFKVFSFSYNNWMIRRQSIYALVVTL